MIKSPMVITFGSYRKSTQAKFSNKKSYSWEVKLGGIYKRKTWIICKLTVGLTPSRSTHFNADLIDERTILSQLTQYCDDKWTPPLLVMFVYVKSVSSPLIISKDFIIIYFHCFRIQLSYVLILKWQRNINFSLFRDPVFSALQSLYNSSCLVNLSSAIPNTFLHLLVI